MSLPDNIRYCKQLTCVDCSSNRLERYNQLVRWKEMHFYIEYSLVDYVKD